jgi:hypothetical protein
MFIPNPILTSFWKFWKVILRRFELLSFSFKGDNIFVHLIDGLNIGIDKLVVFFLDMFVCLDVFDYYDYYFSKCFDQLLNIYQQNFQFLHL